MLCRQEGTCLTEPEAKELCTALLDAANDDDGELVQRKYEVPILPNFDGQTCLDLASSQLVAVIFERIQDYRVFSVNRFMVSGIISACEYAKTSKRDTVGVPQVYQFLEKRVICIPSQATYLKD